MTMDKTGKVAPMTVRLVEGGTAPRYDYATIALDPIEAVITEKGMASDLPLVDLHFEDDNGTRYVATTSGRIVLMIASAIRGANLRNHGRSEP